MAEATSGGSNGAGKKTTRKKTTARGKTTAKPGAAKITHTRSATKPATPAMLRSFNPRTGEIAGEFPSSSPADVADAVELARKVAPEWAAISPAGRAHILKDVRHAIYTHLDDIVEVIATETGKPRTEALFADIMPAVLTLMYYERTAARVLRPKRVGPIIGPLAGMSSKVEWKPFGVVGCITPWNYPFFLTFMGIAAPLFAGNVVVLKPSEVTPGVGEMIRKVLDPLPPGVATVMQGAGDVGAALVDAPCDKICFIGSPATGRRIAGAAAKHLTPVVMELGGKDAAIVCADADLDIAAAGIVWGSFTNTGQTCAAVERTYVVDSVADEFNEILLDKVNRLKQQPDDGDVGSLTFKNQLEIVQRHLKDAIAKGATVLAGGEEDAKRNKDGSLWQKPVVITDVSPDMDLSQQETFGPILPIFRVADEEEAIRRTNEDSFNLTSSVWTKDQRKGEAIAKRLRAGAVGINDHAGAAGAVWAPWGGVGESGYGRLQGYLGLMEFSVPLHIGKSMMPNMKKLWWYPYNDASRTMWDGVVRVMTAPTLKQKLDEAPKIWNNISQVFKNKL